MPEVNLKPPPLHHYLLTYLYVFAAFGTALFCALVLRDVYRLILINLDLHRYTIHANVIFASVAVLGIGCLVYLIYAEHYFRTAPDTRSQLLRFGRFVAYPLLVVGLAHLIHTGIGYYVHQHWDTSRILVGLAEVVIGLGLLFLTARSGLAARVPNY